MKWNQTAQTISFTVTRDVNSIEWNFAKKFPTLKIFQQKKKTEMNKRGTNLSKEGYK